MSTERRRQGIGLLRALGLGSAAFVLLGLLAPPALAIVCPGGSTEIDVTLTGGSRWELCFEESAAEGIVFRDIHFTAPGDTARRVMKEGSLSQIHLVYDDDRARRHLLTEVGLGGSSLVDLSADQCPDGTLLTSGPKSVLCQREAGRGYVWKYYGSQRQGYWLELTSISRTGDLTWVVRWRFYDDGAIEPAVGSTGELEEFGTDPNFGSEIRSTAQVGVGWVATYYWRLDFDIGTDGTDDLVERFEVSPTGGGSTKDTALSVPGSEIAESVDPALKRSWRVRDGSTTNADGHFVSYHLEPLNSGGHRYVPQASESWADHDFAVTVYDACERHVSQNPTTGGCAADLTGFVDGQSINGADVVVWYRTMHHHLPRDEDHPYISIQWQGFIFVPRDWTFENPLSGLLDGWRTDADEPRLSYNAIAGGRS